MSSLIAYLQQVAAASTILFDDVIALAKPALGRIGDTAMAARMAAASTADDIIPLTKLAIKKAGAVVVDDTAVSSDQLNEGAIAQHREYAVWRKIVVASLVNKVIVQGVIMLTGAVAPVIPQLMLAFGAGYLGFEGAHKMMEYGLYLRNRFRAQRGLSTAKICSNAAPSGPITPSGFKLPAFIDRFLGEDPKERCVLIDLILLDAILSTEILLVANGALGEVGAMMQAIALGIVGAGITMGVYGVVLCIVRVDNVAGYLANPASRFRMPKLAYGMMYALPYLLKVVGIIGTLAMLGVAGDVAAHMLPAALQAMSMPDAAYAAHIATEAVPRALGFLPAGAQMIGSIMTGFIVGICLIGAGRGIQRLMRRG